MDWNAALIDIDDASIDTQIKHIDTKVLQYALNRM